MKSQPSITRILLVRLAALFLLAPVLGFVLILVIGEQDTNPRIDNLMEKKADGLAALLHFGSPGALGLDVAALRTLPLAKLRFAVYQNDPNVPVLRYPADLRLKSWDFFGGYQTVRIVTGQPVRLFFATRSDSWSPWLRWFADELTDETLPLVIVLMCISLPLAALSVRYGLKPVRMLSLEAASIEPGYNNARLTEENVPVELLPLVRAVNDGLERLDAGLASQRRFSATVAHELRTPLAVLLMQLEREPWSASAAVARDQLQRLSRLVEQLLTISELTSKRVRADATIDVTAIARTMVAHAVPAALDSGVILEFEAPATPMLVKGNAAAVGTALRNLIGNAVRHSPRSGRVIVRMVPAAGIVEVSDQGEGIPEQERLSIFEPFWKKPSSTGRGLGLAIVREMADLHGATVSVRDNSPVGSIFRIKFPEPDARSVVQRSNARSNIRPPETVGLPDANPLPP